MTDTEIIEKGYTEFSPSHIDDKDVEKKFQKRISNEIGKKYFITINKWKKIDVPHTNNTWGPTYEFHTQLYNKQTREPVNLLFFAGWTIESVEEYLEKLFETGLFDYYEKF